jgi:hypothetical protein
MARFDSLWELIAGGAKQAPVDPVTGTVSKLDEAVMNMRQNKMQANQVEKALMGMGAGVKRAEMQDTGLLNWLDEQGGSVTQRDIAEYLDQAREPIGVTRYDTKTYPPLESLPPLQPVPSDAFGMTDELRSLENPPMQLDFTEPVSGIRYQVEPTADHSIYRTYEHAGDRRIPLTVGTTPQHLLDQGLAQIMQPPRNMDEALQAINARRIEGSDTTKHSGVTDPGLDLSTYKEDVITLPGRGKEPGVSYEHESHWPGVENPMIHLRSSHRELDDGSFAVHVEELQSDWHQEAGKLGAYFSDENFLDAVEQSEKANRNLTDQVSKGNFETDTMDMVDGIDSRVFYHTPDSNPKLLLNYQLDSNNVQWPEYASDEVLQSIFPGKDLDQVKYDLLEAANKQIAVRNVQNAPPEAPMQKGEWQKFGIKQAIKRAIDEGASGITLPSGDDMIMKENVMGDARIENGLRRNYDQKLPSVLKDIGKQYGVKPEMRKMYYGDEEVERLYLPLTDEMIEKIMNEGMKKYGKTEQPQGILGALGDMYV